MAGSRRRRSSQSPRGARRLRPDDRRPPARPARPPRPGRGVRRGRRAGAAVAGGRPPAQPVGARGVEGVGRAPGAGRRGPTAAGRCGITVVTARDPRFPPALLHDPQPPAVLFVRGDLATLDARRVGRGRHPQRHRRGPADGRRARAAGWPRPASRWCPGWPRASTAPPTGVCSRCAGGRAVAVVGNGPDVPYPKVNAALWAEVCGRGLLLSEWPPGTRAGALPVPHAQPHHRRAQRGAGGRREP